MTSHNKALAFVGGLLAGGFLFLQFGWDNNMALFGWKWYQGAALLGGIGLAAEFPEAQLGAAIGLGIAPFLIESVQTGLHISRDSTCCNLWPIGLVMILFFGLPAPLIGVGISRLFIRIRLPRTVYLAALTSSLMIGALLPNIQNAQHHRLETETVPGLLKQIYGAEMAYRARQPGGNFACDGTLLPGAAGKLGWSHVGGTTIKDLLIVQHYSISLDCPNYLNPHGFRVRAFSHDFHVRAPEFSIDETGKFTVSKE